MSIFVTNRRASFYFEIIDTFEAGLVLFGTEVKSIRSGQAKLEGGHIIVRGGEAYVVGISISPFQPINTADNYDVGRPRKLLLTKKELARLERETERARLTAVPLSLYNKNGKIKLAFALARGKNKTDKRESLKKRDTNREIERTLKK